MRDQQLVNGQKRSGSGKHESLPSSSRKPGPAWSSSGPSQTGPAPENHLLLPTFMLPVAYGPSVCPTSPGSALLHPFSLVPPSASQWANCDSGSFVSQRQGWGWGERGRNNLLGPGRLRASGGRSAGALGGVQGGEGRKSRAQGTAHAAGAQNSAGGLAERLADPRGDADPTLSFPLCVATPPLGLHPGEATWFLPAGGHRSARGHPGPLVSVPGTNPSFPAS